MEGWWGAPTNVATGVSLRRHDYTARRPSDRRRPLEQAVFALHEASATRIPRSRTPPSCAVKSPSPNSRAERRRHVHVPRRPRAFDTHPAPAVTNPFFKPIFTGVLLDHVDVHPPQVHLGVPARVGNSSPTSSISRSPVAPRGTLCRTIPLLLFRTASPVPKSSAAVCKLRYGHENARKPQWKDGLGWPVWTFSTSRWSATRSLRFLFFRESASREVVRIHFAPPRPDRPFLMPAYLEGGTMPVRFFLKLLLAIVATVSE